MKKTASPSQQEVIIPEDKLLISKTNSDSELFYANTFYCQLSGFNEKEIYGKKFDFAYHHDMPSIIYKMMWDTLRQHREFNGYIKNKTRHGDYYWSFCNITQSYDLEHHLIGYYLVNRKPEDEKLEYIKSLYKELKDIEDESNSQQAVDNSLFKLNTVLNAKECGYDEFILSI